MGWKRRIWKIFTNAFPFFSWIKSYGWKSDLFADFVAGCTVGVMQIPQGKFL
jgi:MFS superfamily sulfate permease-like transporter